MPWKAICSQNKCFFNQVYINNDSISRPNSRPKLPFPGNGKGKFKMPREGKGRETWGLYSRESRETGIPAHPCHVHNVQCSCFYYQKNGDYEF